MGGGAAKVHCLAVFTSNSYFRDSIPISLVTVGLDSCRIVASECFLVGIVVGAAGSRRISSESARWVSVLASCSGSCWV